MVICRPNYFAVCNELPWRLSKFLHRESAKEMTNVVQGTKNFERT